VAANRKKKKKKKKKKKTRPSLLEIEARLSSRSDRTTVTTVTNCASSQ
jgi:hypothetical protein